MRFDPAETSNAHVSADGSTIAFGARQDVGGHRLWHVIVRNVRADSLSRADISARGQLANGDARLAALSADGKHVLFTTTARDFGYGRNELYERDLDAHVTRLISVTPAGGPFAGCSGCLSGLASSSRNGSLIVFTGGTNASGQFQVWLRDVSAHRTILVSHAPDGSPVKGNVFSVDISPDGSQVVFGSDATNLISNDTNNAPDIFLWTRANNRVARLSAAADGSEFEQGSLDAHFTSDGRHVVFSSDEQLTSDACPPYNNPPTSSFNSRNTYLLELATHKITHPKQSCDTYSEGESDTSLTGSDNGTTIALATEHVEVDYLAIRVDDQQRTLNYVSRPTSITADGRFVGIDHYDPADYGTEDRKIAGALVWDLTKTRPTPAWLVSTQP